MCQFIAGMGPVQRLYHTQVGLLTLIAYLLYQSIKVNQMHARYVELARTMAFLEQRVRNEESQRASDA